MYNIDDRFELNYYQTVCQIQDDCIKGKIAKKECEQKLEIERLKYISYLKTQNKQLNTQIEHEKRMRKVFSEIDKQMLKHFNEGGANC